MIFGRKKVSVAEFSKIISLFIMKEVKLLIDDTEKLESLGLKKSNASDYFINLLIIHTYATCKAFELIDIKIEHRNQIFDGFHNVIISKLTDSTDEYDELYAFFLKIYDTYNNISNMSNSQYLIELGGKFYRSLLEDEADAITVFNISMLYIDFMSIVKDAYPKYKIKFN